jgi:hypothetical protein
VCKFKVRQREIRYFAGIFEECFGIRSDGDSGGDAHILPEKRDAHDTLTEVLFTCLVRRLNLQRPWYGTLGRSSKLLFLAPPIHNH